MGIPIGESGVKGLFCPILFVSLPHPTTPISLLGDAKEGLPCDGTLKNMPTETTFNSQLLGKTGVLEEFESCKQWFSSHAGATQGALKKKTRMLAGDSDLVETY